MISFSKNVKKELCEINIKLKNCCAYSFIYGFMFCASDVNGKRCIKILNNDVGNNFVYVCQQLNVKKSFDFFYEKNRVTVNADFFRSQGYYEIRKNVIKCAKCKESFLRGLFLAVGNVSNPDKSYRLELIFDCSDISLQIAELLNELRIFPLVTERNGKSILYLRRSEAIEDFFANIGATSLAFDIMNSKINKELINNANRVTNCDAANINKALSASSKYNTVINQLIESGAIIRLPEHLREMAQKRIEHAELSFFELGKQFSPPISKSGVHHRLEKIIEYYNEFKEKNLM